MTPPLVGVAVNVTLVPEQMVVPGFAAILTLAGTVEFALTAIAFDVAKQGLLTEAGNVIDQFTIAPTSAAALS